VPGYQLLMRPEFHSSYQDLCSVLRLKVIASSSLSLNRWYLAVPVHWRNEPLLRSLAKVGQKGFVPLSIMQFWPLSFIDNTVFRLEIFFDNFLLAL
jgi:hypothetical protein